MTESKPRWAHEQCSVCGIDGLSTRSAGVPGGADCVCRDYRFYQRGYGDGTARAEALYMGRIKALTDEVGILKSALHLASEARRATEEVLLADVEVQRQRALRVELAMADVARVMAAVLAEDGPENLRDVDIKTTGEGERDG